MASILLSGPSSALPTGTDRRLLCGLLAFDLFFILVHIILSLNLQATGAPWSATAQRWSLVRDGSLPEILQYAKWLAVAVALFFAARRHGNPLLAALSLVFLVVLLDDALALHERLGLRLVHLLPLAPAFGLRAQDFGELLVWGGLGAVVAGALVRGWARATPIQRRGARPLLVIFALLLVVGIAADMLHVVALGQLGPGPRKWALDTALAVVEDGGEMVLASLAVAVAIAAMPNPAARRPS